MRRTPVGMTRRSGFTLVELLVVITIIGILMALTGAAVVKVMVVREEAETRSEISQLAAAVQAFKQQYAVPYIPSTFTLKNKYLPGEADLQYLKSVWPRIGVLNADSSVSINWGALSPAAASGTVLNGAQCLVLFLGGPDGTSGFSNSPVDPMGSGNNRVGPFFEFKGQRLVGTTGMPLMYNDPYGNPFVYFSSQRGGNDYPTSGGVPIPCTVTTQAGTFTVYPFQLTANRFANPSGFQIISAGKDGAFGNGRLEWAGVQGQTTNANGQDDMSNFYPIRLGVAAN